jgi:hypothetical protein
MPLSRWNGSSFAPVGLVRRWTGSAWQTCSFVRRWNGTAWVDVWTPLAVTGASPVFGSVTDIGGPLNGFVQSDPASLTVTGGAPGYTYSWARISGSALISADSPTSPTTRFSGTIPVSITSAVFRVTVTDTAGSTATFDATVNLQYERV